ncbi:MAG: PilZ domain-containing protein [Endomicrobiia bacterium]|nr:PilZ domain-containing protein [Endomicrobiaceae bacterium]MDD3922027.1 PilZ domain-containing protein [Endomicrobiaceae bacterium]MDD5102578.1 PilZ domain-containing protein [Endomicrobiaceae bacterium]
MLNRRRHPRLPVIKDIAREVAISTEKGSFPGIIINLSASGMSLLSYSNIPEKVEVCLALDIPTISTKQIYGKIIRVKSKSIMWEIGILFTEIDTLDSKKINRVAVEFTDCDNKIALGAQDVCKKECSYYFLCNKKQKIK